jgi:chromosome segregation ATPase
MEELITPLVDRLVEHKDHLNQQDNTLKRHHTKLEEFKEIIYKTDNKLDVFDEINAAITKSNSERLILEDNMKFEVGNLRTRMDDIDERNEQTIKQFGNMQTHTKELIEELTDLKDTYKKQSESFVGELRKLEERQIRDFDLITRTTNGLTNLTNEHGVRLNLHDS